MMLEDSIGYWDPTQAVASSADMPFDNPGGTFHRLGAPEIYLRGQWAQRNRLNVPGPFYCGDTDTCWTGRIYAPGHVLYDDDGLEFVYRQPVDHAQMHALLSAAVAEAVGGYAADGDEHWTPHSVREWWRDRHQVLDWIGRASQHAEERELLTGLTHYAQYIVTGLEAYLRCYSFWLDNRRPPQSDDWLPNLR